MWCCTSRRLHLADTSKFNLPYGDVEPSETDRDLDAFCDQAVTMTEHINRLVKTCNFQLRGIRSIRRSLPMITALQLVNSFVISRIDYCNSILWRLPKYQQDRLQSVLNVAARLIYECNLYDHITDLLRDRLHWLRVITFKCCLLVYKSLHGLAPPYITSSCVKKSTIQHRSGLRSASRDDLVIPATKSKFGECSFAVGGPSALNHYQS